MARQHSPFFELYLFVRVIVATLVLGSTAVAQIIAQEVLNIHPLNALVIYMLGYTLFSAFLYLTFGYHPLLLYSQYLADLSSITVLVYLTGSYSSPLTVLYILFILTQSYYLSRQGLLRLSSIAIIFYGLLVIGILFGFIPPYPSEWFPTEPGEFRPALFSMLYTLAALVVSTFLLSIPVERARRSQHAMAAEKRKVLNLQNILQFLVTHLPSPFFITDTEGYITFANAQGRELLHMENNLFGKNHKVVLTERLHLPIPISDLNKRSHWNFIIEAERNSYFDVRIYSILTPSEGVSWIWLLQDVTEDLKRQEQLRIKDKMASLGQMAAGLAHEFKNPLAAIHASVQLLQKTFHARDGSSPRKVTDQSTDIQRVLPIIEKETRRLRDIVDQFLKFAQPHLFQPAKVPLRGVLEEIAPLLRMTPAFSKNHELVWNITPDDLQIIADPGGLKQIFWNLIINAVKVMPDGGTVTIDITLDGRYVRIQVRDEGPGIPPSRLNNLFVPFQKSTIGGLGLGLAVVYNIVQQHGGTIRAWNNPVRGATFEIVLPIEEQ